MKRATKILAAGSWDAAAATGSVLLTFDDRYRRRTRLSDTSGEDFLLDLEKPRVLQHGEGLVLEGGGILAVRAADEPVADIHTHSVSETARIAWHIGNRHIAVQVLKDGALRIRDDAVLVQMIEGLGAHVHRRLAPFSPEGGAYSSEAATQAHHHHHGHDHEH
ncbi:MAG TPA: urease accessory protein UreE [Rhizomicrobium sp.]|jgi:urease accessory protein|nr:urease accessory protein UreE [Rhizomicrobium sp.]